MSIFKKRKFYYILAAVVVVLAAGFYFYQQKTKKTVSYETARVERGVLAQTVDATGKIKAAEDLDLHFEVSGTVEQVLVKEGDIIKIGTRLASLRLNELNANLAQAQANLNQKLAGATDDEKSYYRAAAQMAKADLDKAMQDGVASVAAAESALATAKNNLDLTQGGENSQLVVNAYQNAVAFFNGVLATIDDGLTQADNILGIENTSANESFKDSLSALDSSKLRLANGKYLSVTEARASARAQILPLTAQSAHSAIDAGITKAENTLTQLSDLLLAVKDVLAFTPASSSLSQTSLDAKKTAIETARTAAGAKLTSLIGQEQAISEAKNSSETYRIAYEKAQRDLNDTKISWENVVKIKAATYEQAQANLDKVSRPPREVDVASYRAILAQAVANRDKAIIYAPIDGAIVKINKKKGELILSSEAMLKLLSPSFEIEVDIPETDIAKVNLKNEVEITLDAFGDDMKFKGQVLNIEPASTEIQDVVYYRVRAALEKTDAEIKPGMTANLIINTAKKENVLFIPFRAVLTKDIGGFKYVRVLKNNNLEEREVKLGLRGDDGKVEILDGLQEGEEFVTRVRE